MPNGASSIHKQLRTELENYIKSQLFGKSPVLLSSLNAHIDDEGLLYQKPYIESSPAYVTVENGLAKADLAPWMKDYFSDLAKAGIGIFPSPYEHQIQALEAAARGENLFVSTGTGSGKTECFMWPLLAKMASEARSSKKTWEKRGIRTIIMYPMNALVSDQVSRLRKMIGDPKKKFITAFRKTCGSVRRPQFGMYTGRTPYPGEQPSKDPDRKLERTLRRMSFPEDDSEKEFFQHLQEEGKIPAKADLADFLDRLLDSDHTPDPEDAELITRFEMQQFCPDILITNYSMLEYMLLRPRERKIWSDTREWLASSKENKLLFVIDEAHMYRGSSGGEVSLLIRRLFHKLGIGRDRVQFILTTASMPNQSLSDRDAVMTFANELTASDEKTEFRYLKGRQEIIDNNAKYDIPADLLLHSDPGKFENRDLSALLDFWKNAGHFDTSINSLEPLYNWMYDHLIDYRPFHNLIKACRGNAVSLGELSSNIFPTLNSDDALKAISVLLAIAPLAKNAKDSVLFPARMHMLFRGISGVYACTNPECSHSHSDGGLTLGEIYLSDSGLTCPHCGSVVYELYEDRRCGALFFKGYILDGGFFTHESHVYLWHYPGQLMDKNMKEIHLFIPEDDYLPPKSSGKSAIKPCYLDIKSGFINFADDSLAGKEGIRKLYYCNHSVKDQPGVITFADCPHCTHKLSSTQLVSFSTQGNLSFFNLIQSQFKLQPAVPGKDKDPYHFPNQGRKVLLFSDSRQRAAKLARDMSNASDIEAARQLFVLALAEMKKQGSKQSMDSLYDYFCLAAGRHHLQLFHGEERNKFEENCRSALRNYERYTKRNRDYDPRYKITNAPLRMQKYVLRLFAGGYNTLYDSATSWIEPTEKALEAAVDELSDQGIEISEEEFKDFFNAWMLYISDRYTALGHTISDTIRMEVRPNFDGYGLKDDWAFSAIIREAAGWQESGKKTRTKVQESKEELVWKQVLKEQFLDHAQPDNGRLYVDLTRVKARFDPDHVWYKCEQCSELTPFLLKGRCPSCGAEHIHEMRPEEYDALSFWRKPLQDALDGKPIQVIDTEEHTAQLSHKDQRDDLWSKTEQYELRFQDLVQDNETPVDILSSTTTMEVGIDIGSLVAVGLRNIPPTRENYQQRAGRAGRRGSSLSTIITFCENGPHDTMYFKDPTPMLRGDPRRPWIDVQSEKLLQRHLSMVILQTYLDTCGKSLDTLPAHEFLKEFLPDFKKYMEAYDIKKDKHLLPPGAAINHDAFVNELEESLDTLHDKCEAHPELFGVEENNEDKRNLKSLLDALYEEGIIPTYSFPKNVVSTYIPDRNGKILYEVSRGLDVAIGEYAPGRAIVVDKQTYQIGGFYYPGSERKKGQLKTPARSYTDDPNYMKHIISCDACGWFDLYDPSSSHGHPDCCPFCGNTDLKTTRDMMRPWGFAPKNGESIPDVQLSEEYTAIQQPLYSTLPDAEDMELIPGCKNIRSAKRTNQRILMLNRGIGDQGFMVCPDCGASMPGDDISVLKNIERPYKSGLKLGKCSHINAQNVNLGFDFITDMLVLEFKIDRKKIDTRTDNPWLSRAAQSLAEALRLAASKRLDVDFTELVTGYRLRSGASNTAYIDIYLYDSLSSGAGYAVSVADAMDELLHDMKALLEDCDCRSACPNCLKHYRNQNVHGLLDRFAALQLLEWGEFGITVPEITPEDQIKLIQPLENILRESGCKITISGDEIHAKSNTREKQIIIYPAMWAVPHDRNTIYISDALMKYAKPSAVKQIVDNM